MGTKIVKKSVVKPKKEGKVVRPKKETKQVIIKSKKAAPEPESESQSENEDELKQVPNESSDDESDTDFEDDGTLKIKKNASSKEQDDESSDDEDFEDEELGGFSSTDDEDEEEQDDDESENDEEEEEEEPKEKKSSKKSKAETHQVKKLPKVDNKTNKKSKKTKKGVIYIGRLPDGFEEAELSKYFNQFGEITNIKLARNKKTGNSRHFGFLEFNNGDDAKIAQETMNNYLLMNHQLKVELVQEEFKSSKKAKKAFFKVSKLKKDVGKLNAKDQAKREKRAKALEAAGINF
ncbi:Polyadenylate-binding protein 1 [Wickerhamomyces ciferrii]|uniref:Polyadenylate-binding protein 1 n=1 Tax=Wickerhamomyces ciferrii (strain ATCC 14091 / BCRC 22168 / CBS 111 / JCM 3599 / NBRC 0793 / NRRL Y-1031 F-60-10) TaxID=1206466 RepID=K0KDT3_WICCF|nr:Polyadenylate-binding protein 1 [Wickerhamomyces ciferrii]CCH41086.1 Polyadenylate-binding protein 1 [Wickerhamomyces ciferrii]